MNFRCPTGHLPAFRSTNSNVCLNLRWFCFALTVCLPFTALADGPSLLRMFSRGGRVQADPAADYTLAEEDGPWMILAHTFVGEGSRDRAQRLVMEIRRDLQLPAFVYREQFDFTGEVNPGKPMQATGSVDSLPARKMRYANRVRYDAHAVLVGEYDRVNHPKLEEDLQRIKTADPAVFSDREGMAAETDITNPVTTIKAIHQKLLRRRADKDRMGPMASAFVTRNPMLPEDYFQPPQVDSFVAKLNEDMTHSLLECQGKYTVVVRTFEGLGAIVSGTDEGKFQPSIKRLDECAAQAQKMTAFLRKEGHEAYQFHDRTKSIVTIGSFDTLGRELPGGRFQYDPGILAVMNEFRAFNVDPKIAAQVSRKTSTAGMAAKHIKNIPFDVQPTPIAVPKVSKRSLYSAMRR